MAITQTEAGRIIERLQSFESNGRFQNFIAQVHSRSILQGLGVSPDAWPRYTLSEEDLHHTAHYLFWQGLELKSLAQYREQGNAYILRGCEILEFLYQAQPVGYPERTTQLFNAALGYYISGHYARAYVLVRQLQTVAELPPELELLRRFFEKNLAGMRELISNILEDETYTDVAIARSLQEGETSEDEALHRIMRATFGRIFSYFIEFPKTGDYPLLERAKELAGDGIQLALRTGFVDWWWWFYCVRYLLDQYDENSMWRTLSPFGDDDPDNQFVKPYIRANYSRSIPVIELWPSQISAVPYINETERGSYCLKMPTSAGKTRIAELAILRFLLDDRNDPGTKCIYLAPFRSLAVEVEESLQKSFHPLGARVSELYGGFELSPIERLLLDETRILVATPEKIDAFLRYNPEFADQIHLIIIDEGHIISLTERGIKYEVFLHRLVRRFARNGVRIFFISAVLPNTEEFAEWLTRDPEDVILSEWRPSRLLLGELRWDGRRARIDYLESDHEPLGHDCFIPNFIQPINPQGLPGIQYRRPFPNDIREVVAEAGVRFAQQGTTMIFCARKASAGPMADTIVRSLEINRAISRRDGTQFGLPVDNNAAELIEECVALAEEHMGADNDVSRYLRWGFAIHHSDIPKPVRIKLERLVRTNAIRLIVATTTLAQGVNLPVQTVIVHGLSHGHDPLTPITFWNICGRAGRGMRENQGQVLFAVDLHMPNVQLNKNTKKGKTSEEIRRLTDYKRERQIEAQQQLRREIIEGYRTYYLLSALRQVLVRLVQNWRHAYPNSDVSELCIRLAENDLSWFTSGEEANKVQNWLDVLDAELIALVQEDESEEPVSPDVLQRILDGSLLYLQAGTVDQADEVIKLFTEMLFARWQYTQSVTRSRERQRRFYRLGFPLNDCQTVEENVDELLDLLLEAEAYEEWSATFRCDYLTRLAAFVLSHVTTLAPKPSPCIDCWARILNLWLLGYSPNEIAGDSEVAKCTNSPAEVSKYIEDVFGYKLPWGFNALNAYLNVVIENTGVALPEVTAYFSALVKYGVHSPVASCLLAVGLESRKLALKLASVYTGNQLDVRSVLLWLSFLSADQLAPLELSEQEITLVNRAKENTPGSSRTFSSQADAERLSLNCPQSPALSNLAINDMLVLVPRPDISPNTFSLSTLWGSEIGLFDYGERIPSRLTKTDRVIIRARDVQGQDSDFTAQLEIEVQTL